MTTTQFTPTPTFLHNFCADMTYCFLRYLGDGPNRYSHKEIREIAKKEYKSLMHRMAKNPNSILEMIKSPNGLTPEYTKYFREYEKALIDCEHYAWGKTDTPHYLR